MRKVPMGWAKARQTAGMVQLPCLVTLGCLKLSLHDGNYFSLSHKHTLDLSDFFFSFFIKSEWPIRFIFNSRKTSYQLYPWYSFVTFSALTHSPNTSGFLTAMQLAALKWRLYLNLLPSLNRCCVQSIGPYLLLLIFAFTHFYLDAAITEWTWGFCIKQGGLPGLSLFLTVWMEVSISVTTAGFTEQTCNSKATLWLSLHQRSSQLLGFHCLVGFWKRHYSGFFISNNMVHQIMTENPTCWVLSEIVDRASCHVVSHLL